MTKRVKIHKSIPEQIEILKSRNLIIDDPEQAIACLKNYNYYRLSGYSLTLREGSKFYKDVKFSDIMQIYFFDKELKLILLGYLEEIEISLRTYIGYTIGMLDPLSHLDQTIYAADALYENMMVELKDCISDNKHEAFILHHQTSYDGVIPCWVIVETFSFGCTSRFFTSLKYDIQKEICTKYFNSIPPKRISSWLECLVVLRNMCAHKSRLINRGFSKVPDFSIDDVRYFKSVGYDPQQIGKRLFFMISLIEKIYPHGSIIDSIKQDLSRLSEKYPFVDIRHYGFKSNWEEILKQISEK